MKKIILILLCSLLLVGCSTNGNTEKVDKFLVSKGYTAVFEDDSIMYFMLDEYKNPSSVFVYSNKKAKAGFMTYSTLYELDTEIVNRFDYEGNLSCSSKVDVYEEISEDCSDSDIVLMLGTRAEAINIIKESNLSVKDFISGLKDIAKQPDKYIK